MGVFPARALADRAGCRLPWTLVHSVVRLPLLPTSSRGGAFVASRAALEHVVVPGVQIHKKQACFLGSFRLMQVQVGRAGAPKFWKSLGPLGGLWAGWLVWESAFWGSLRPLQLLPASIHSSNSCVVLDCSSGAYKKAGSQHPPRARSPGAGPGICISASSRVLSLVLERRSGPVLWDSASFPKCTQTLTGHDDTDRGPGF